MICLVPIYQSTADRGFVALEEGLGSSSIRFSKRRIATTPFDIWRLKPAPAAQSQDSTKEAEGSSIFSLPIRWVDHAEAENWDSLGTTQQ